MPIEGRALRREGDRPAAELSSRGVGSGEAGRIPHVASPVIRRLFAGILAVYILSPNSIVTDSVRVVPVAEQMWSHHSIGLDHVRNSLTNDYGLVTVGRHVYPLFPWTISLFLVPITAFLHCTSHFGIGISPSSIGGGTIATWPVEMITMSVVLASASIVMYKIGRCAVASEVEVSRRRVPIATALVFAFGTPAWSIASRSAWQHAPSMLFLSLVCLFMFRSRTETRDAIWLGVWTSAAYVVRPTNALALIFVGCWLLLTRRSQLVRFVVGAAIVLIPFLVVNEVAYRRPLPPYFFGSTFDGPVHFWDALLGNLISPSRGLFIFSPILVLALWGVANSTRKQKADGVTWTLVAIVIAHWLLISSFPNWTGGWGYGPRFFADMAPLLVALSIPIYVKVFSREPRDHRAFVVVVAVLAVWSVSVHAEGAILKSALCWNVTPDLGRHYGRVWSWDDAQFTAGVRGLLQNGPATELVRGGFASGNPREVCSGART